MAPIFAALLPAITSIVPELLKIFGDDAKSDKAKRNVAVASAVSNAFIKSAEGAVNLQDAVERAQSSPEVAAKVRAAVMAEGPVQALLEIGGGIEAARKNAADPSAQPFWRQGAFVVALVLTPLIYMTVYRVLWSPDYSEQLRTVVVTAILSGLLGALTGYFFGSMYSSSAAARRTTDEPKTA